MNIDINEIYAKIQLLLAEYGMKVVAAVIIFILGRLLAKMVKNLIKRLMVKAKIEETIISFTSNITYSIVLTFVIIAALNKLGIQTASIVAVLGAAGLAVGLALQGSLANFSSGVLLILFRPFKVGDYVEAGGTSGIVEDIEIFSTQLRTPDNKSVIVPNSNIYGNNIINYSAKENRRLDLKIGVSYSSDIKEVKDLFNEIVNEDERILKDPAPKIALLELADSSLNFVVRPWVKTSEYWDVYFDLMEKIKIRCDEKGIEIPFPQRDVHLYQESPAS